MLSGCSMAQQSITYYTLSPEVEEQRGSKRQKKTITVLYPKSVREASGSSMLYQERPLVIDPYRFSKWQGNLNRQLLAIWIDIAHKSTRYRAVLPYTSQVQSDLLLESNIHAFYHLIEKERSWAVIKIGIGVIDKRTGRLLKHKRYHYKVRCQTTDAAGYTAAVNEAMSQMAAAMQKWL
jgi:ABC-type uncharacterized transport system auxiliary subunit